MSKKPVPSKKQAVSSTRSRWASYVREKRKKIMNKMVIVPSEEAPGKFRLAHQACPHTGKYRGKQVIRVKQNKAAVNEIQA